MGILERVTDRQRIGLAADCLIGRSDRSDLQLANPRVSQEHARIFRRGDTWLIRDLGSSNGTIVGETALQAGEVRPLTVGSTVEFGHRSERWELVDEQSPRARLLGTRRDFDVDLFDGIVALPDMDAPQASVYYSVERGWVVETENDVRRLKSGDLVQVGAQTWRFFDAGSAAQTTVEGSYLAEQVVEGIASMSLHLEVSHDFEHVHLEMFDGTRRIDLGVRACYFLVYVLAKERFGNEAVRCRDGWMTVEEVNRAMGRADGGSHLNVDIFRIRKAMREQGLILANDVIERRRGALRLGPGHGSIRVL